MSRGAGKFRCAACVLCPELMVASYSELLGTRMIPHMQAVQKQVVTCKLALCLPAVKNAMCLQVSKTAANARESVVCDACTLQKDACIMAGVMLGHVLDCI